MNWGHIDLTILKHTAWFSDRCSRGEDSERNGGSNETHLDGL
jgi:hypothetical protein